MRLLHCFAARKATITVTLGGMNATTTQRISHRFCIALGLANLLIVTVSVPLGTQAYNYIEDTDIASIVSVCSALVSASVLGIVILLGAWGPGPMWLRLLAVVAAVCGWSMYYIGVDTLFDNWYFDRPYYYPSAGMQLASHIGHGTSLAVPMMMIMVLVAGLGRWRIGDRSLGPIQFGIAHVMIGTGLLAVLFVVNAEIQHRFYSMLFSEQNLVMGTENDFASVNAQRIQTMMIAAVTAPVCAIVVMTAAWSAYALYARLGIVIVLSLLGTYTWIMSDADISAPAGMLLGATLSSIWIAGNVRLLGWAGWPLSRRHPGTAAAAPAASDEPPESDGDG